MQTTVIFLAFALTIFGSTSALFDSWEDAFDRSSEEYHDRHYPRPAYQSPPQCGSDTECPTTQCCHATRYGNQCVPKPSMAGEPCGGPYGCVSCDNGLKCVPVVPGTVVNKVSVVGTCQIRGSYGFPATEAPRGAFPQGTADDTVSNNVV